MSNLQQLLDKKYPFGPEMSHTDEEIRKWQRHDFSAGYNAARRPIIGFAIAFCLGWFLAILAYTLHLLK